MQLDLPNSNGLVKEHASCDTTQPPSTLTQPAAAGGAIGQSRGAWRQQRDEEFKWAQRAKESMLKLCGIFVQVIVEFKQCR
jgi:hypothetical protein